MIRVDNIETYNHAIAIFSARNAMNSWDKSDSDLKNNIIGEKDLELARKLYRAGPEHRKYARQIFVSMDVVAPLYWWSEYDTYKVGTVANSCSKMHKLLSRPFEMNDFSFDHLFGYKNEVKQFRPEVDEENESWIELVDYPEYFVSTEGRVKHNNRILSGSVHNDNYIYVNIKGKQIPIHRLVADCWCPVVIECDVVNHIDGNKMNNKATNLEWCTQQENVIHSIKNNFQPKNLSTYTGKFTPEERRKIKDEWDEGNISRRKLAEKYGVSHTCINDIINDKYKYVEKVNVFETVAKPIVDTLNEMRDSYLICDEPETKKKIWYGILQLLPESYNQKRTVTMNYENVFSMIHQRSEHKLDEWISFCEVLRKLPYVYEITKENER